MCAHQLVCKQKVESQCANWCATRHALFAFYGTLSLPCSVLSLLFGLLYLLFGMLSLPLLGLPFSMLSLSFDALSACSICLAACSVCPLILLMSCLLIN